MLRPYDAPVMGTSSVHAAPRAGYRTSMTTTPNEPLPDPEVVPSGDPIPTDPGNDPGVDPPPDDPQPEITPLP